ncbi:MAG: hypothetical protein Q8Q49_02615 [bacterium]|nr:hypothetical protein [bacterium]
MEKMLKPLEDTLELYFGKKAPALPANIKEVLVKIAPYLAILSAIITVPAILLLFGLGGLATTLAPTGGVQVVSQVPLMWVSILLLVPVVLLDVMSIPGLFKRSLQGWTFLFWAQLISLASNLVQFNIVGALIGGAIGFYILFQIKSHYK